MLIALSLLASAVPSSSVIVGDIRLTALSPRLLRVEPKGPLGFEDAATFLCWWPTVARWPRGACVALGGAA